AKTVCLRAKANMPRASKATAHISQLMLPARMMPGAIATIAASQGRRPVMRRVAMTVTIHKIATSKRLISKYSRERFSIPVGMIEAAAEATVLINTGYSNWAAALKGAHGFSAKPRAEKSGTQSL